jgi:hypothetical protein
MQDTVAPFLVTATIGLYGYEANNVMRGYVATGESALEVSRRQLVAEVRSAQPSKWDVSAVQFRQWDPRSYQCYSVHYNCNVCSCKSLERINPVTNPNPRRVISHTTTHLVYVTICSAPCLCYLCSVLVSSLGGNMKNPSVYCATLQNVRMLVFGVNTTAMFRTKTLKIYVRCEVFTAVTIRNAVFWDKDAQKMHYFPAIESSLLMQCKIWSIQGGDYKECRLLGYKNPFLTSQETYYVSATETSHLILFDIWGIHGFWGMHRLHYQGRSIFELRTTLATN